VVDWGPLTTAEKSIPEQQSSDRAPPGWGLEDIVLVTCVASSSVDFVELLRSSKTALKAFRFQLSRFSKKMVTAILGYSRGGFGEGEEVAGI